MKTPYEKKRAIKLYRQGLPVREIAELVEISESAVRRAVREADVKKRPAHAPRKHDDEKVVKLYKDAKNSIKDIMEQTGVKSEQTIYAILRRSGIALRKG